VFLFTVVAEIRVIIVIVITNMSTNENLLLTLLDHMHICGYMHAQTSSYFRSSDLFNNIVNKKKIP